MLRDYFYFAWSNLVHKKIRGWLTLIGILIGVVAVVSLVGLGDGLKLAVSSQFGISSTEIISVQAGGLSAAGPPGTGVVNPLTRDDVEAIEDLSVVDVAIARLIETGTLEFNDILGFGFAANMVDENRKLLEDVLELEALEGRLLKNGDYKKAYLGYNFGQSDNGFDEEMVVGDTILLDDIEFEIVGINKKKGSFIFDNIVIVNDEPLVDLLLSEEDKDRVDVIAVKVKDKDLLGEAKLDIEELLRKRRDVRLGEEDFSVETPESSLSTVNSILTGVQVFIAMIASISIIVGTVGIVNTMFTAVLERRKTIGIMKAIGAKNSDIFFQFLIESGLMGFIGGLIGVIIGELIAFAGTKGISNFLGASISPEINYGTILITLVATFVIGAIAGIVPAMQAARQHPVDSLRD